MKIFKNLTERVNKKRRKGFSAIEFIAVLSAIIILAAGVFFAVRYLSHTTKMAKMHNEMEAISAACLTYEAYNINGLPPTSLEELQAGLSADESIDGIEHSELISSTRGNDGEILDPWGTAYGYDQAERVITCTPKDTDGEDLETVERYF